MGAAVMGGGIQFGLSTLLPSPAPSGTDSSLQQARAVAGEVTARLQALPLSDGQRYILASSLRPAPRNPFTLPANGLPDAQQAASANASGLVYSGYVQAGKEALAIIGGLEYGVGDTLPNTGDRLHHLAGIRFHLKKTGYQFISSFIRSFPVLSPFSAAS